jgi:predicted SnoaL-like aldol condensation-catalyzing enzyme
VTGRKLENVPFAKTHCIRSVKYDLISSMAESEKKNGFQFMAEFIKIHGVKSLREIKKCKNGNEFTIHFHRDVICNFEKGRGSTMSWSETRLEAIKKSLLITESNNLILHDVLQGFR